MTVLITGFAPFENDDYNVSGAIAESLHGKTISGHNVVGVTLPVVRYKCIEQLKTLLAQHIPAVVISLGYARVSSSMRLERTAINMDDYRIPDNAGNHPIDERIFADAPDAYFTKLPIKRATQAIRQADISAHVNESAGAYLCNHIFFGGLYLTQGTTIKSGFVHVPPDEKLAGDTTGTLIPFTKQCQAIEILAELALTTDGDDKLTDLGKGWD